MSDTHYYLSERCRSRALELEEQLRAQRGPGGVTVHAEALLLPPCGGEDEPAACGVCDRDLRLVAGPDCSGGTPPSCLRVQVPSGPADDAREVIYGGIIAQHPRQLLEQTLLRLWYALAHPELDCPIAFALQQTQTPPPLLGELMDLAGLGGRLLIVSTPTRFRRIIVPEACAGSAAAQGCDAAAFSLLPEAVAAALRGGEEGDLYLSRRGGGRPAWGEEYFEDFFAARGFAVIRAWQLSCRELLAQIAAARSIACTEGTLSRLAMFARRGTRLICLCAGAGGEVPWRQLLIGAARGLESVMVDVGLNFLPALHDSCAGSLIGPSRHWQDFVRGHYGLDPQGDVFDGFSLASLNVSGYVGNYLQQALERRQLLAAGGVSFDQIAYLRTLFETFDPQGFEEVRRALCVADHAFFRGRRCVLRRFGGTEAAVFRLSGDCSLEVLTGAAWAFVRHCRHWSFVNGRLYLLDDDCRPAAEFVVIRDRKGDILGQCTGTSRHDPALWLSLQVLG